MRRCGANRTNWGSGLAVGRADATALGRATSHLSRHVPRCTAWGGRGGVLCAVAGAGRVCALSARCWSRSWSRCRPVSAPSRELKPAWGRWRVPGVPPPPGVGPFDVTAAARVLAESFSRAPVRSGQRGVGSARVRGARPRARGCRGRQFMNLRTTPHHKALFTSFFFT